MTRTVIILALIAVMSLTTSEVMATGAGFSPPPGKKITGPSISAVVVIDPHNVGATGTAMKASIRLQKGTVFSGAVFTATPPYFFDLGCTTDQAVMENRFERPLKDWIPGALVIDLFSALGIVLTDGIVTFADPVITGTGNAVCTTGTSISAPIDPDGPGPREAGAQGILSFDAVVNFLVPH